MSINVKVAQLLYALRVSNKKTQSKVGQSMNVTFQQVQKYEKMINLIPITKLEKFCSYFKITISDFFNLDAYSIIESCTLTEGQKLKHNNQLSELEMLNLLERKANDKGGSKEDMAGESISQGTHI
tara:strand:+ start:444 stop:821 length:378 start_codon:yes stop_codon:yes gene_type:complete